MKTGFNSVLMGALAVGISIVIVLGGILLALAEGNQTTSIAAYPTLESIDSSTPTIQPTAQYTPTEFPTGIPTVLPTATPSPSPTMTPTFELTETETIESTSCDYQSSSVVRCNNYFKNKCSSYVQQARKLYLENDANFRGFRQM